MPSTGKSYQILFVVIDAVTKFVWIFVTKTRDTAEVLKSLEVIDAVFGSPKRIISDRGGAFMSSDFEEYCKEKGIQQVLITTGVPRSNGQVERVNAIISAVFTKVAAQEPLKWYQHVTRVQKALNSTYQRSIGMSSFELLFGAKMREYGDLELKQFIEDEWRNLFIEQRDELRFKAKEQI